MSSPESRSGNKPKRTRRPLRERLRNRRTGPPRPPRRKKLIAPIDSAAPWEVNLAWFLKLLILITIASEFVYGEFLYGLWGLAAFGIISLPIQFARSHQAVLPVEFEIILLLVLSLDVVFGRFLNLYDTVSFYDKIIHWHDSLLIAFSGFLLIYSLYFTGRLKVSSLTAGFIIMLITVGMGAIWEIMEYTADHIFRQGAQGSPIFSPLDDTMWDLICDFLGGIMGAVAGSLYIRYSQRTHRRRFYEIMTLLGGEESKVRGEQ